MKQELLINVIFYLMKQPQGASLGAIHRYLLNDVDYLSRIESFKNESEKLVPLKRVINTLLASSSEFHSMRTCANEILYFCRQSLVTEESNKNSIYPELVAENDESIELSDQLINKLIDKGRADESIRARVPYLDEHQESMVLAVASAMLTDTAINITTAKRAYSNAIPQHLLQRDGVLTLQLNNRGIISDINVNIIKGCSTAFSSSTQFRR